MHHIQHHILTKLGTTKWARFSDMRPPKVDSNAYSYHLKLLVRQKLIEKHPDKGYRLTPRGMTQVDRMSTTELNFRMQPKIITMCLLYSKENKVLLLAKSKQPFIGAWTYPSGKLHIEDGGPRSAVIREINERVAIAANDTLAHAADVYINASIGSQAVSTILAHVFTMRISKDEIARQDVKWVDEDGWGDIELAPGVKEIYGLIQNNKNPFTYAEYSIDW